DAEGTRLLHLCSGEIHVMVLLRDNEARSLHSLRSGELKGCLRLPARDRISSGGSPVGESGIRNHGHIEGSDRGRRACPSRRSGTMCAGPWTMFLPLAPAALKALA